MKRVLVWVDRLVAATGALLLLALLVPVSIQVFARLVPDIETPLWTEEAARFLLVWLVMVGSLYALRRGNHFTVDVLPTLGPAATRVVRTLGHAVVLGFGAFFVWYQTSEVADWPLWILFLAWPVAGAFWMVFAILSALRPADRTDERSSP